MIDVTVNKNLKTSQADEEYWELTLTKIPRGTQTMSKAPDQFVDGVHPKFIERGEGAYVYDYEGNKYLDYPMALGPILLGHCHPEVNQAVKDQMEKGTCFSLPSRLEYELAAIIRNEVPCAEDVRFAKNGTDANLGAVRAARSFTNRENILYYGYHGWGDWYAAATERNHGVPKCLQECVFEFKYNDLLDLEQKIQKHTPAAIIMEACSLTKPANGFLQGVRNLANTYGIVLIFDEVVTGFRWSIGGAQHKYVVHPDLCTMGKGAANGYPLSFVCGNKKIMKEFNHIFFSSTFGGELLSIAAAIKTIEILKTKDYNHIWSLGQKLHDGINKAIKDNYMEGAIELVGEPPRHNLRLKERANPLIKDYFYQEMIRRGILWGNVIYITFAHTEEHIDYTIKCANEILEDLKEKLSGEGDPFENLLDGKQSVAIFRKNT